MTEIPRLPPSTLCRRPTEFSKLNCLLLRRPLALRSSPLVGGWKGLNFRKVRLRQGHPRHFGDQTLAIELDAGAINHGFVVATCPLSPTGWHPFRLGELIV